RSTSPRTTIASLSIFYIKHTTVTGNKPKMVSSARFFALERHATAAGGFSHRSQPCSSTRAAALAERTVFCGPRCDTAANLVNSVCPRENPDHEDRGSCKRCRKMAEEPNGAQDHAEPARGRKSHSKNS